MQFAHPLFVPACSSIDQPLLLRLVNYGNIVEHKDILEALLRVHGVSDVN